MIQRTVMIKQEQFHIIAFNAANERSIRAGHFNVFWGYQTSAG
jgi:hypothetical protein